MEKEYLPGEMDPIHPQFSTEEGSWGMHIPPSEGYLDGTLRHPLYMDFRRGGFCCFRQSQLSPEHKAVRAQGDERERKRRAALPRGDAKYVVHV